MAIMFADDFKGYGSDPARMLDGLYGELAYASLIEDPDPNADGYVFVVTVNAVGGTRMRRVFPGNVTTAGFAFRMWIDQLYTHTLSIGFLPADGNYGVNPSLQVDNTGRLLIRKGNTIGGTLYGTTTNPVITAHAWNHIEVKMVASGTVGTVEVRVNGKPVLTVMGVDTGTQYSQIYFNNADAVGDFQNWYFKDFVTWNGLGAQNTSFIGTCQVIALTPNSDILTGWTPSIGTSGWDLINQSPPLDATDYVVAPFPLPPPSTFGLTNLPVNVSSVRALITQVRARKVDGGDGNLQASLLSSGDAAVGLDRPITTAFTYYEDVFEVDPHTAAAWTPGAVDLATLKLNRTL